MGFFAVFKLNKANEKYEFVDRWLNGRNDEGWIERTILAMGWNSMEVIVTYYFAGDISMCGFDDELNLLKYKSVKVPGPEGVNIDSVVLDEKFAPQIWFKDGSLLKKYTA